MSKTQLTPKQLFETRNTTDVFDRAILVGLLKVFNRRLFYEQRWDDTEEGIENVCVPFFYDFGGSNQNSEKFIQDNYTNFTSDECTDIGLQKQTVISIFILRDVYQCQAYRQNQETLQTDL